MLMEKASPMTELRSADAEEPQAERQQGSERGEGGPAPASGGGGEGAVPSRLPGRRDGGGSRGQSVPSIWDLHVA